jgi:hypothetical protein
VRYGKETFISPVELPRNAINTGFLASLLKHLFREIWRHSRRPSHEVLRKPARPQTSFDSRNFRSLKQIDSKPSVVMCRGSSPTVSRGLRLGSRRNLFECFDEIRDRPGLRLVHTRSCLFGGALEGALPFVMLSTISSTDSAAPFSAGAFFPGSPLLPHRGNAHILIHWGPRRSLSSTARIGKVP